MATEYSVRNFCEDEDMMKRTIQIDIVDDTWQAPECVSGNHTTRDFVIEGIEEVI